MMGNELQERIDEIIKLLKERQFKEERLRVQFLKITEIIENYLKYLIEGVEVPNREKFHKTISNALTKIEELLEMGVNDFNIIDKGLKSIKLDEEEKECEEIQDGFVELAKALEDLKKYFNELKFKLTKGIAQEVDGIIKEIKGGFQKTGKEIESLESDIEKKK